MKISVVEAEPFGTVNGGVEGGEERVVELLVHDLGGEHDRKGAVVEFGEVDKVDVAGA